MFSCVFSSSKFHDTHYDGKTQKKFSLIIHAQHQMISNGSRMFDWNNRKNKTLNFMPKKKPTIFRSTHERGQMSVQQLNVIHIWRHRCYIHILSFSLCSLSLLSFSSMPFWPRTYADINSVFGFTVTKSLSIVYLDMLLLCFFLFVFIFIVCFLTNQFNGKIHTQKKNKNRMKKKNTIQMCALNRRNVHVQQIFAVFNKMKDK